MNMKKILFFSVVVLCNFRFGLISAETVEEHVENVLTADHRHHPCTEKLLCILGRLSSKHPLPRRDSALIEGIYSMSEGVNQGNPNWEAKKRLSERMIYAFEIGQKQHNNQFQCSKAFNQCLVPAGNLLREHRRVPRLNRRTGRRLSAAPGKWRRFRRPSYPRFQTKLTVPPLSELRRHPLFAPREANYHCQACEAKRSSCTMYYIGTYGVCGAAWAVGGAIGSAACNVITLPRTVDCTLNTWENCYLNDCGMFNINFLTDFLPRSHKRRRNYLPHKGQ